MVPERQLVHPASADPPNRASDAVFFRKIQKAMLPHSLPSCEDFTTGMFFVPGTSSGGDLFDVIRVGDDLFAFLMLEVEGTIEQTVCIAAMVKDCFIRHIHFGASPFAIVERVSREIESDLGTDLHLRTFFGFFDLHSNEMTYCNAGCSGAAVYRSAGKTVENLIAHGTGLIGVPDRFAGESRVFLGPGDGLVLFSAGANRELRGASGQNTGDTGLFWRELFMSASASELCSAVPAACRARLGAGASVERDLAVLFIGMLTTTGKEALKESLGFNAADVVYLQFFNYLEEIDRVTGRILGAMDSAGYPDELIRKMKIVLTELLVNAVIHGNRKESMRRVVAGHLIDRDRTVISIMDEGDGFDPAVIPDPTLPENIDKPCGRGLFIVRHFVETIRFNRTGNRVTIVKCNSL